MSGLHYKKDGSLDMRFNSSRAAVASGSYSGLTSPTNQMSLFSSPTGGSDLNYKKDGTLDMRYNSSKQAAASYQHQDDDLHRKKDGTLDMRYKSSREAAASNQERRPGKTHDSSEIEGRLKSLQVSPSSYEIPSGIPTKKDGTPDMRTAASKNWVVEQARLHGENAPRWVPRLKDGTINEFSPLGRAYKMGIPANVCQGFGDQQRRADYWQRRNNDADFQSQFGTQMEIDVPEPVRYDKVQNASRRDFSYVTSSMRLKEINIKDLSLGEELGKGGFGVVRKAVWRGEEVAVKQLHLNQLTRKDKENFRKELEIASQLQQHPNLVATLAYSIDPPLIVMELVKLGSLAHILHFSTEPEVEAKICDGRIKRQLAFGIADGMWYLHSAKIIHNDLKPQNVLVSTCWTAKISDFGLAELRGRTSCSVASGQLQEDDLRQGNPAGTAAYMAPELLDSDQPGDYSCDVYSFGVLLNELVSEEQPYSGQMHRFAGRGPFGAANFARHGNRPTMARNAGEAVSRLIERCWNTNPECRPTFEDIVRAIENRRFVIPNGGGLGS